MKMHTITFSLVLLAISATACGTAGPQPGDYTFVLKSEGGSCEFSRGDPGALITDGGMQTIDISDGQVVFRGGKGDLVCPLDDISFGCTVMSDSQAGLLSTVSISQDLAGEWHTDTELDLTVGVDLTCEGDGCNLTGALAFGSGFSFPCGKTWTFSGQLVEPSSLE
jgi:hypothetical protein